MKFYLILILCLSNASFAGSSCGKDYQALDLSSKGGPLYPLRVTHQDGLGICHIEQLNKLLKGALPNHPDLSRMELAIVEKASRDEGLESSKKKAVRWYQSADDPGGTYIDAGSLCDAYSKVKGKEICLASQDEFEELSKKDPYDQEKIFETLAMFFDNNKNKKEPGISMFMKIEMAFNACSLNEEVQKNFINSYKSTFKKDLKGPPLNRIYTTSYLKSKNMMDYLYLTYPDLKTVTSSSAFFYKIKGLVSALSSSEKCATQRLSSGSLMSNIINKSCGTPLQEELIGLSRFGFSMRDLFKFSNVNLDRDEYFLNAFSCRGKKVLISKNLKCNSLNLVNKAISLNNEKEYTDYFSNEVDKILAKNNPVGISICTRFFKNKNAKTIELEERKYSCGEKASKYHVDGEGSHAVTLIGKRCRNGEVEYLLQNSWGAGCGYYAKDYDCTGKGGFWVKSSTLSLNTRAIYSLTK